MNQNNYTIEDGYLVTSDPSIAVLFLGENLSDEDDGGLLSVTIDEEGPFVIRNREGCEHSQWLISIPLSLVAEIIKPVWQQDPVFYFYDSDNDDDSPGYREVHNVPKHDNEIIIKANAITIGRTVGQLRELIAATEGEG